MKNLFILTAAAALTFGGCNSGALDLEDIDIEVTPERVTVVNDSIPVAARQDYTGELYAAALDIYRVHKDIEIFAEATPADLAKRLQQQDKPELSDLVLLIHIWWQIDDCGDLVCEWPAMDDFLYYIKLSPWAYLFTF